MVTDLCMILYMQLKHSICTLSVCVCPILNLYSCFENAVSMKFILHIIIIMAKVIIIIIDLLYCMSKSVSDSIYHTFN